MPTNRRPSDEDGRPPIFSTETTPRSNPNLLRYAFSNARNILLFGLVGWTALSLALLSSKDQHLDNSRKQIIERDQKIAALQIEVARVNEVRVAAEKRANEAQSMSQTVNALTERLNIAQSELQRKNDDIIRLKKQTSESAPLELAIVKLLQSGPLNREAVVEQLKLSQPEIVEEALDQMRSKGLIDRSWTFSGIKYSIKTNGAPR